MHKITKFYIFLLSAIVIAGGAFAWTFSKAKQITVTPNAAPLISEGYYEIPTNDDPVFGNPGSPLTIIIFSDFACTDCQKKYSIVSDFVKTYPQATRLFVKYSPQPSLFFKSNDLAYRGAICANKQNKFWEYNDLLITDKNPNKQAELEKNIEDLKINEKTWQECLTDQNTQQKIAGAVALSQTLGINKVPVIYVNNKRLNLETEPDLENLLSKLINK